MKTTTVDVETPDGAMPLYEAVPDADPSGAVVVVQEVFGVNDHIEDVTRRFADAGYHAVAPHLFHRTGSPKLAYDDFSKVIPHMAELNDERVLTDFDAATAHLSSAGWAPPQTAVVGFCFGGRVSFLVSAERPLGAAVGFYGGGIVTSRFPQFPTLIEKAPFLKTPWLGLFGDHDESIPIEDVERLKAELSAATTAAALHEVVVYPGVGHGFHCDMRPDHYSAEAAADGWKRTISWLERHLEEPPE